MGWLGFICHHNSHIREMRSSIWQTKTTLPHYLFIPTFRSENISLFLRRFPNLASIGNVFKLLTGLLSGFMQKLPSIIVSSYSLNGHTVYYKHDSNME